MKAFILTLCLFISFELVAQECEFETTMFGSTYERYVYDKPQVISSDSSFYIISVGEIIEKTPGVPSVSYSNLIVKKYDKCNVLIKTNSSKIQNAGRFDIIITKESVNKWNICIRNLNPAGISAMFEMNTDCNLKQIFVINTQQAFIKHFIRSSANQFIFVGHKNSKATVFATDTLGNKTWQIVDSTKGLPYSFYNQIQKGTDNKIYLLGAANNKFTKSVIDMDGTITNTLYIETGTTQILDSLNYGLTFSQNGQYIYSFIAINNYQLLNKYDDLGRQLNTNLMVMGKITEVFRLKATSNGFVAFTDYECYLIDANLIPYLNKIASYGKHSGGHTGSTYTSYQSDLLLENDSFIVSLSIWIGGTPLYSAYSSHLTFYKAKITSNLYKPKIVASDSVTLGNSFLYLKVQEVSPVYVSWWSMDNNQVAWLRNNYLTFNNNITTFDTTKTGLEFLWYLASGNSTTTTICARNYFKAQWSVDVCQEFTFNRYRTSIANNDIKELIQIYPNPASDFVEINTGRLKNVSIELYNLLGQEIPWQEVLQPGNGIRRLYFTKQTKGIYTIKINTDKGAVTQKILIAE